MATFILLHDAFQDGGVWQQVCHELRDRGHAVHAPSYAGCGLPADPDAPESPTSGILDYLEHYICNERLGDAVLVCPGFSGMLGPRLAASLPGTIRQLFLWDAVVPEPGRSFLDLCPSALADGLRARSTGPAVAPLDMGPLRRLAGRDDAPVTPLPFALSAFTEKYVGPPHDEWPTVTTLHTPLRDTAQIAITEGQAILLGSAWIELDLDEYPVMGRAQEVARVLDGVAPRTARDTLEGCGRNTMPREMRMLYCARYRKRQELAALSRSRTGLTASAAGPVH